MSETALDVLARIKRNARERDFCLAVLDLWANVQAQGIEMGRVASFGFDTRALTPAEKQRYHAQQGQYIETLPSGKKRPRVYNYVRHHDQGITRLDPMLAAVYEED